MRQERWPVLLDAELHEAAEREMVWGSHDCLSMAVRCEAAMCGGSDMSSLFEKYRTPREALRRLSEAHMTGLVDLVDHFRPRVSILSAQRGDWVGFPMPDGPLGVSVGVCTGTMAAVASEPRGILYLPVSMAEHAWRIE